MLRTVSHAVKCAIMTKSVHNEPLLVIVGATGTGKSQLAIDLAKRFNGEVINGDAMQMYQGLPIVTNKVTIEEQQGIPHHLLGMIALTEQSWRVGMFKKRAMQILEEIRSRGCLPILVGGTHYYTQSLLFEDSLVGEVDDVEESSQKDLSTQEIPKQFPILDEPTEVILDRLREVDPVMAKRWHPKDRRKIQRSLEIFLTTGTKASDIYARQKEDKLVSKSFRAEDNLEGPQDRSTLLFWVHSDPEVLKKRLDLRVDKMMECGLLDEVKSLDTLLRKQLDTELIVDQTRGIWVSIGWKEFKPYLQALKDGTVTTEELSAKFELGIEQTKAATRQYAKRQVRWIRLKLIPSLVEQNLLERLYLLDGSNISTLGESVSKPAIDITQRFLSGQDLPVPVDLSSAAHELLLFSTERVEDKASLFRKDCEICNTTVVAKDQWEAHLNSRRHRALLKKHLKNQAISTYHGQDHDRSSQKPR